ncbi:MAG TPA: hypothetical protein VEB22_12695 [Phycisphaerales bacterium]|nr:hypothetical protein [Phycisphaerales bacterium]
MRGSTSRLVQAFDQPVGGVSEEPALRDTHEPGVADAEPVDAPALAAQGAVNVPDAP